MHKLNTYTQNPKSSQSKYQEVNKRRTKKLRDTRKKFEIQRERAETFDEEKLQWRRGEASAAMRGARAAELQRECFDLEH
jgi:hypothetical protein